MPVAISTLKSSDMLQDVKTLWSSHRATLGFFPDGAFEEYMAKGWIVIASEDGQLLGYTIYRLNRGRAAIVHLCVDPNQRGKGIARQLVDAVKQRTSETEGIIVSCRRDFEAHKMWHHFDFAPIDEKRGKSKQGHLLVIWWFDHLNARDLFTTRRDTLLENNTVAVIDNNILLDLYHQECEICEALFTGWILDEVSFAITPETYVEINRNDCPENRKKIRGYISQRDLIEIPIPDEDRKLAAAELKPILSNKGSDQDVSDFKQVRNAIAGKASFFITKDSKLLKKSDEIFSATNLLLVHPSEFITHFDKLIHEAAYQPERLAGSNLKTRKVDAKDANLLWERLGGNNGEKKNAFVNLIRNASVKLDGAKILVVEEDGVPVGVVPYLNNEHNQMEVPLLRVAKHRIESTINYYLISEIVLRAAMEKKAASIVTDQYLSSKSIDVLRNLHFTRVRTGWAKIGVHCVGSLYDVIKHLMSIPQDNFKGVEELRDMVHDAIRQFEGNDGEALEIERRLWPAKIQESGVPCYIVPIRPQWAMHLFDAGLAGEQLFGVLEDLALNRENVYYRSTHPFSPKAPARILWYVSGESRSSNSKQIRACSLLEEVVVDKPKAAFGKFKRLGIYEWKDVFELADKDLDKPVAVLKFSGTESFTNPMSFSGSQDMLVRYGMKKNTFTGPVCIPLECFEHIYQACMNMLEE